MKRLFLLVFLAIFAFTVYEYLSAPQFWKRYVLGFMSGGQGAYSRVFDFKQEVPGAPAVLELPVDRSANFARGDSTLRLSNLARRQRLGEPPQRYGTAARSALACR